jgi:hypothetical protein
MLSVVGFLLGSKVGRYLAAGLLIAAVIGIALWRARLSGAEAERAKMLQKTLENIRTRIKVDDEVAKLPADQRLERLNRWAIDG